MRFEGLDKIGPDWHEIRGQSISQKAGFVISGLETSVSQARSMVSICSYQEVVIILTPKPPYFKILVSTGVVIIGKCESPGPIVAVNGSSNSNSASRCNRGGRGSARVIQRKTIRDNLNFCRRPSRICCRNSRHRGCGR